MTDTTTQNQQQVPPPISLDPPQLIKLKAKRIIVGHVLIPKLKNLKERVSNSNFYISKDDLFTADTRNNLDLKQRKKKKTKEEKNSEAAAADDTRTPPEAAIMPEGNDGDDLTDYFGRQDSSLASFSLPPEGKLEASPEIDQLWDNILELVERGQEEDGAEAFYRGDDPIIGDGDRSTKEVLVQALIFLCTAVSPSPVITTDQKKQLFYIIEKFANGRPNKNIGRSRFIKEVKKHLKSSPTSQLHSLDLAEYALYMFPEGNGTIEADALVDLVNASSSPSEHHSFAASYVKVKASERLDFADFLIYIPFVILYLTIVLTGKGLSPRSYHAHNMNSAFNMVLYGAEFPQGCTRANPTGNAVVTTNCGDDEITFGDVESASDWYDFANGPLLTGLWGSDPNGKASSTLIQENMRLVGALKIRQLRQQGIEANDYADFFNYDGAPSNSIGFAGRRYSPHNGDEVLEKSPYASVNYTGLRSGFVQGGINWNGFHYATCDEGNSTQGQFGDVHRYSCDGFSLILPFNYTQNEAAILLHQLEANNWIDVQTQAIVMDFYSWHPATGYMMSQRMLTEFHPAGAASSLFRNRPFAFWTTSTNGETSEGVWVVFVIYLFCLIIRLIWRSISGLFTCCQSGFSGAIARQAALRQMSSNNWAIFDLINYTLFVVHLGYRLRWISFSKPEQEPVWQVDHYPKGFEQVAWDWDVLLHIDAVNVIFIILSVLRYTKYIGGLDIVINTLQRSVKDCISVFVVSFGTFLSFVVTGYAVWGDTLEDYRTFSASFMTLSVINEVSYRQLHDEHPGFTYFFFTVYHFVMVACLLNMLIAVFSEAYNDVQDANFNTDEAQSIFDNNPRRALTKGSRGFFARFHFLQLTISSIKHSCFCCGEEDKYCYSEYYIQLMSDLRVLLVPFQVLVASGEIREDRDVEDSKECLQYRVEAACRLLILMEENIPAAKITTIRTTTTKSRNIYEYCQELYDEFDYPLVFALFVLVPQNKFDLGGRKLLVDACSNFTKWSDAVLRKTHEPTEADKLQVQLETTLLHDLGDDDDEDDEGLDFDDDVAAECLGEEDVLKGLGAHARLVIYGVVAGATDEELGKDSRGEPRILNEDLFVALFERASAANPDMKKYLKRTAPEIWDLLGLTAAKMKTLVMLQIHAQMQEFFAVRTYSFLWSPHEIARLERWMLEVSKGKRQIAGARPLGLISEHSLIGQVSTSFTSTMQKMVNPLKGLFTSGESKETSKPEGDDAGKAEEGEAGENKKAIDTTHIGEMKNNDGEKLGEFEVVDGDLLVDQHCFQDAWEYSKESRIPSSTLPRVFSTSHTERVSMIKFLRYCNANPWAHFRQNFGYFYAHSQSEASKYYINLSIYLPLLALIVFFLLEGSQLGESIHVTRGLHSTFDLREKGISDFAGTQEYLKSTVVENIWSGAADEGAQRLNDFNFYVGALRIRQRRLFSRPAGKCQENWENFIGPFVENVGTITYPTYMNDDSVTKTFYENRVFEDFYNLRNKECYGAYDFGVENSQASFGPLEDDVNATTELADLNGNISLATSNRAIFLNAFTFRADGQWGGSDSLEAHDAIYPEGGYSIIIPFSKTRADATSIIDDVFANNWIDNRTRVVVAEFIVLNYNLKIYTKARYGLEITAGGGFWPIVEVGVSAAASFDNARIIIITIVFWVLFLGFVGMFLGNIIGTISEVRRYLGYTFFHAVWHSFATSFVNTIDLIIVVFTIASWVLRAINAAALQVDSIQNNDEFPTNIGLAIRSVQQIRKLDCVLIMIAFQRTFYFIRFIRRLQIIFLTFANAAKDLVSILFLFGVAIIAFALSGVVLYGYQLQQFFNIQNSFLSLFLHVMGENDFEDMMPARPEVTPVFSHMMSIICAFVLFNLVVGVLTDTYGSVKNSLWDSTSAESVLEKHRQDDRKPKSKWQRFKNLVSDNFFVMEIRYMKDYVVHCGDVPLELQMRNRRVLWDLLASWQRGIDTGLPEEAVIGAANMMYIAAISKPAEDHIRHRDNVVANGADGDGQTGDDVPKPISQRDELGASMQGMSFSQVMGGIATSGTMARPGTAVSERFTASWFSRRRRRRLRTYGVGRLPLWEEFLHDRLGAEVKHTLQWYYIQPPNKYIQSVSMPDLWLEGLENYFYYKQVRDLYTGNNEDSSSTALENIKTSLEHAVAKNNNAKQKSNLLSSNNSEADGPGSRANTSHTLGQYSSFAVAEGPLGLGAGAAGGKGTTEVLRGDGRQHRTRSLEGGEEFPPGPIKEKKDPDEEQQQQQQGENHQNQTKEETPTTDEVKAFDNSSVASTPRNQDGKQEGDDNDQPPRGEGNGPSGTPMTDADV